MQLHDLNSHKHRRRKLTSALITPGYLKRLQHEFASVMQMFGMLRCGTQGGNYVIAEYQWGRVT